VLLYSFNSLNFIGISVKSNEIQTKVSKIDNKLGVKKMEKRQLGNSDLELTRIGFGAWAIGGSWEWGWGE
jgi:hypothetical protein